MAQTSSAARELIGWEGLLSGVWRGEVLGAGVKSGKTTLIYSRHSPWTQEQDPALNFLSSQSPKQVGMNSR